MQEENSTVDTPVVPTAAATADEEAAMSAAAGEAERLAAENAQLSAEKAELAAEKAELQDLLLRRQADYDNSRRRVEREKAEMREFAAMASVEAMLPILDDFERSLQAAPADDASREYTKGIALIHQRLLETLSKLGLEPIPSTGQPFDPNLHNAIQKEDREDVADQTVLEEYQRGYFFRGRLLRPAMVKVAVKP